MARDGKKGFFGGDSLPEPLPHPGQTISPQQTLDPTNSKHEPKQAGHNSEPSNAQPTPTPQVSQLPEQAPPPNVSPSKLGAGFRGFLKKHKKGGLITGGIGGAILILMISFLAILPFKAIHFLKIIENKTFARIQNTVEIRTEKILGTYVERKLLKSPWGSKTTDVVATGNMLHDLYDNWAVSNFEKNFEEKYDIKFERDVRTQRYNVTQGGRTLTVSTGDGNVDLTRISNNQFRNVIKEATAQETKWFQIYKRHHIRKALYLKYNVKNWVFFKPERQQIQDRRVAAKKFVQRELNNRVVKPVSSKLGSYFGCLIDGGSACDNITGGDGQVKSVATGDDLDRDNLSKAEKEALDNLDNEVRNASGKLSGDSTGDAVQAATDKAIDEKLDDKAISETVSRFITREVGQKVLASIGGGIALISIIEKIDSAAKPGGAIEKIMVAKNSTQYAQFFTTNATAVNQIMAGESAGPKTLAAAIAPSALSKNFKTFVAAEVANDGYTQVDAYNEQLGDPTESRIYKKYYAGIDLSKQKDDGKRCAGDQPLPASEEICPEKKVKDPGLTSLQESAFFAPIHVIGETYRNSGLKWVVSLPGAAIDAVFQATGLNNAIQSALGAIGLQDWISKGIDVIMSTFFGPVISGAETDGDWFDANVGGADVSTNASAQTSLGARPLTDAEQQAWAAQTQNTQLAKTEGWSGVKYKLTSLEFANSATARVIAWTPAKLTQVPTKMASLAGSLLNPDSLFRGLTYAASIITPSNNIAFADSPTYISPFGVTQWGYALNDIYLNMDAEELAKICEPGSPSRQKFDDEYKADFEAYVNDPTYNMTKTNPCLLEESTINDLKSYFTTADDGGLKSALGGTSTAAGGAIPISATRAEMNNRIQTFIQSGQLRIQNQAAANDIVGGILQDQTVALLLGLLEQGKFSMSLGALKSDHTKCVSGTSRTSDHFWGLALDIGDSSKSPLKDIHTWIYTNRTTFQISELWFDPIPPGNMNIDNGKTTSGVISGHTDHIHVAVTGPKSNPSTASSSDNCGGGGTVVRRR